VQLFGSFSYFEKLLQFSYLSVEPWFLRPGISYIDSNSLYLEKFIAFLHAIENCPVTRDIHPLVEKNGQLHLKYKTSISSSFFID